MTRPSIVPAALRSAERPTSRPPPARTGSKPLAALAVVCGVAIAAAAPLSGLDLRARAWVLEVAAPADASNAVLVVEARTPDLVQNRCNEVLTSALTKG